MQIFCADKHLRENLFLVDLSQLDLMFNEHHTH